MSYRIVFDTETVNEDDTPGFKRYGNQIFDMGLVVANKEDGEIVLEYTALVEEVFNNKELMKKTIFGLEYLEEYERKVRDGEIEVKPAKVIAQEVRDIVEEYDIDIIYAYNASFDVQVVKEMGQKHDTGIIFDFDNLEVADIYHIACQALSGNESYTTFAVEHDFLTDKGNIQATAEAVYAFVNNEKDFVEDHTALSDSIIENDILNWAYQKEPFPGFYDKSINPAAWRLVQSKER